MRDLCFIYNFMSLYTQLFYLGLLIIFSGFFAFSEISLAASRKSRLQTLIDEGNIRAKRVMEMKDKPGKFFSVIQIGINTVAILGGIVGESAFSPFFTWCYAMFLPEQMAENAGFITSFLIVTFSFVIFADLLPKRFAIHYPERIAMMCVNPMILLIKLLTPIVFVLEAFSNAIMRMAGTSPDSRDNITCDDILASVGAGAAAGVIDTAEQSVIENVFDLEHRLVPSAMTARESIVYFRLDETEEEIHKKLTETPHNHFLVCDTSLDNVIGFIDTKDILRRLLDRKTISLTEKGLIQPVQFVPDSLTLSEILDNFQRTRSEFAVILNEYALVVGIITLNDVMSTVMSDLVLTPEESQIIERDENSWLVDGATPTVDIIHALELDELPEAQAYETVAGFMMYMLRKIPKRMDKIDWGGYRFEVLDVDANKIDQVLVTRILGDKPTASGGTGPQPQADETQTA